MQTYVVMTADRVVPWPADGCSIFVAPVWVRPILPEAEAFLN